MLMCEVMTALCTNYSMNREVKNASPLSAMHADKQTERQTASMRKESVASVSLLSEMSNRHESV